jgi:predicted ATP-grasp superfamily ATP-dependent carboligase
MTELIRVTREPAEFQRPLLLHAFGGPIGTGGFATLDYLATQWDATSIADIDPEPIYDFSVARPVRNATEDGFGLSWPQLRLMHARPDGADRDVLLLLGPEPHLRWPSLANAMTEALSAIGVGEAVQVLAFNAATPHTRPAPVHLLDAGAELAERFKLTSRGSEYQGPVGFGAVLGSSLTERSIKTATLVAFSPFYLGPDTAPHAAIELIGAIDRAVGTTTDVRELAEQQVTLDQRVAEALLANDELETLVVSLERQYDSQLLEIAWEPALTEADGSALADEVEAFFRGTQTPAD